MLKNSAVRSLQHLILCLEKHEDSLAIWQTVLRDEPQKALQTRTAPSKTTRPSAIKSRNMLTVAISSFGALRRKARDQTQLSTITFILPFFVAYNRNLLHSR